MGIGLHVHWSAHSFVIECLILVSATIQSEGSLVVVSPSFVRCLYIVFLEPCDGSHILEEDFTHNDNVCTTVDQAIHRDTLNRKHRALWFASFISQSHHPHVLTFLILLVYKLRELLESLTLFLLCSAVSSADLLGASVTFTISLCGGFLFAMMYKLSWLVEKETDSWWLVRVAAIGRG